MTFAPFRQCEATIGGHAVERIVGDKRRALPDPGSSGERVVCELHRDHIGTHYNCLEVAAPLANNFRDLWVSWGLGGGPPQLMSAMECGRIGEGLPDADAKQVLCTLFEGHPGACRYVLDSRGQLSGLFANDPILEWIPPEARGDAGPVTRSEPTSHSRPT